MNEHITLHDPRSGRTITVRPTVAVQLERKGWSRAEPAVSEPATAEAPAAAAPTGTVVEVLAWVGDDPDRAAVALMAEEARPEGPRRTLIDKLAPEPPSE